MLVKTTEGDFGGIWMELNDLKNGGLKKDLFQSLKSTLSNTKTKRVSKIQKISAFTMFHIHSVNLGEIWTKDMWGFQLISAFIWPLPCRLYRGWIKNFLMPVQNNMGHLSTSAGVCSHDALRKNWTLHTVCKDLIHLITGTGQTGNSLRP